MLRVKVPTYPPPIHHHCPGHTRGRHRQWLALAATRVPPHRPCTPHTDGTGYTSAPSPRRRCSGCCEPLIAEPVPLRAVWDDGFVLPVVVLRRETDGPEAVDSINA